MKRLHTIKSLLLYLVLGLCFTACDKDDDNPDPDKTQTNCQLTKIVEQGDDEYSEVAYNAQGYATKLITKGPGTDEYALITYDANNQMVKWEYYDNGQLDEDYITFAYTNNLLTTINSFEGNTLESVTTLKYDTDKRVIEYASEDDGDSFKITYTYNSKGNVTKQEYFRNNTLMLAMTYENYDDKHTPLSAVKGLPSVALDNFSQNNPGKMTVFYDSNGDNVLQPGEQSEVTTYTYKYNSNGFPTEVTETDDDGTEVTTYSYACQ